ncbi:hypothetical protein [Halopiger goleimassiliensis]|uniref:hypothetical protein n=1 Tax=Halopiger goleimassiliensis TaxID=1293048 RepID=UPI0009DC13C0|nr:hypothetical protein [Halopiger goleimassiliensis]
MRGTRDDRTEPDRSRRRAIRLSGLAATGSLVALAGCGDEGPGEETPQDGENEPESDQVEEEPAQPENEDETDEPGEGTDEEGERPGGEEEDEG